MYFEGKDADMLFTLWQYGLWSFQTGGTKLEKLEESTYSKEIIEF